MSVDEILTRGTAWVALSLYAAGEVTRSLQRRHPASNANVLSAADSEGGAHRSARAEGKTREQEKHAGGDERHSASEPLHQSAARAERLALPSIAPCCWSTLGCATFILHVVCAFQFYHGWSHAAAYAETARQTAALTGMNWGGGLYVNYIFGLVWLGEVTWAWRRPVGYSARPNWIAHVVRGFFLFMILNGTVVFVPGPMRWIGVCVCLVLLVSWLVPKGPMKVAGGKPAVPV